jgi:hypothetical protein
VRKWLRQYSKRLPCCGFRRTGKAMGQVYQCWWRICHEINVLPRFKHPLHFISIRDLLTDYPSYNSLIDLHNLHNYNYRTHKILCLFISHCQVTVANNSTKGC